MNRRDEQTIKEAAKKFSKGVDLSIAEFGALRIELPFINESQAPLYFFIGKRKGSRKFSLLMPVESTGLVADHETLARLQDMIKTYGLLLSETAVIMEESSLPLDTRIKNMSQALIGIDGIRRLWKVVYSRRPNAPQSQDSKPVSNSTEDRPSW